MIRVLNIVECMQSAGIESYIMNVYRNIDREKIQFDFFVTRNQEEFYDKEIKELGGKKYTIDRLKEKNTFIRILKESKDLYEFLLKNKYDIVQVHTGTPLRVFYLIAAKKANVKIRIYHSHSAEVFGPHKGLAIKKKIFSILKRVIPNNATHMFACSKAASMWMYPKKEQKNVIIINNGIILDKFKFNGQVREIYRKNMKVNDKIIIGHVARFNYQKNHSFLLDVMKEVKQVNDNYELWLIGAGELEESIKKEVKELNLENTVKFLGVRNDVNNLMQAMDIFVLPSNYEGLPVVGIEAQASGLISLFSKNVTDEVNLTPNTFFLDLDVNLWKKTILELPKNENNRNTIEYIKNGGYDIMNTAEKLQNIYMGVKK